MDSGGKYRRIVYVRKYANGSKEVIHRGDWQPYQAPTVYKAGENEKVNPTTTPKPDNGTTKVSDPIQDLGVISGDWAQYAGYFGLGFLGGLWILCLCLHLVCGRVHKWHMKREEEKEEKRRKASLVRKDTSTSQDFKAELAIRRRERASWDRSRREKRDDSEKAKIQRRLRNETNPATKRFLRGRLEWLVYQEVEPHVEMLREYMDIMTRIKTGQYLGRKSDASKAGPLSDASKAGPLSDASKAGPLSDASKAGPLSDASKAGPLSTASSLGPSSNSTQLSTASPSANPTPTPTPTLSPCPKDVTNPITAHSLASAAVSSDPESGSSYYSALSHTKTTSSDPTKPQTP